MSFKALRRSRDAKGQRPISASTPLSTPNGPAMLSKPMSAKSFVPDKVIRAVESRRATAPQELSFSKGDFFYVTKDVDLRGGGWFEAHNPNTGARGLVPRDAFEELGKQANTPRTPSFPNMTSPTSLVGSMSPPPMPRVASSTPAGGLTKYNAFFAIVQYDFSAERPDELDAKAGEAISVVAQSNREWFVAKPIGRLGGPGLIPVTFVELRDPQSGRKMTEEEVNDAMDKGTLPKVETWKKATMEYKQSSIPLGVIDPTPPPPSAQFNDRFLSTTATSSSSHGNHQHQDDPGLEDDEDLLPPGMPVSATIPSFHQETGEYWFRLDIRYQPDPENEYDPLPPQIAMVLYRNYDDFYAFQLDLLDTWPVEAGREKRDPDGPPLKDSDRILPFMPGPVDDVTDQVTVERRNDLNIYVQELISLPDPPSNAEYILRCDLVRRFFSQKPGDVILPPPSPAAVAPAPSQSQHGHNDGNGTSRYSDDAPVNMRGLSIHGDVDDGNRMSHASNYSDHDRKSQKSSRNYGHHQNNASISSFDNNAQYSPTRSNTHQSGVESSTSRDRESSNVPQSQFLKVKIFHSNTDDLIAIRVSPRITHNQLLEKVRDRLGGEITQLRYEGPRKETIVIEDDRDMREWVEGNSKLVLFAW